LTFRALLSAFHRGNQSLRTRLLLLDHTLKRVASLPEQLRHGDFPKLRRNRFHQRKATFLGYIGPQVSNLAYLCNQLMPSELARHSRFGNELEKIFPGILEAGKPAPHFCQTFRFPESLEKICAGLSGNRETRRKLFPAFPVPGKAGANVRRALGFSKSWHQRIPFVLPKHQGVLTR
jgi:hypothetical protein